MEICTVISQDKFHQVLSFIQSRRNNLNKKWRHGEKIIRIKKTKLSPFSDESDELTEIILQIDEAKMKVDKNPKRFQDIIDSLPKIAI